MPSTLEILEQTSADAECCPPKANNPLTRPPLPLPAELTERRLQVALAEVHDLELLCGAER
jgi:hypothetical protein